MSIETWKIDTAHTSIGFTVRHMVVARVHGRFSRYEGRLFVNGDLTNAQVEVKIDAASIDTQVDARDKHLRSPDFFDVAAFPRVIFRSRRVVAVGQEHYRVVGDLTIKEFTREVVLDAEFLGRLKDESGTERLAFIARTSIDRKDFGLTWNKALETGGVLVGERIDIELDVQAVKAVAVEKAA
ncbi:YceI family protein [Vitiosangium sp. GDMCC 1.1324]|uniref:YceI family protein n=1 Tax=Vitiosangium sp. (strain GDMCC 1.1324) TaxID=2138576 RepID=UPI000D3463C2|nr:YceI family protein [Vitiosangium sp. GDMCC 1.1324]PTL83605.1 polyisoprenoid-binding protein [Vitiosangium sp. GDMCC 1.1324]